MTPRATLLLSTILALDSSQQGKVRLNFHLFDLILIFDLCILVLSSAVFKLFYTTPSI
jgi:hypothetical protein